MTEFGHRVCKELLRLNVTVSVGLCYDRIGVLRRGTTEFTLMLFLSAIWGHREKREFSPESDHPGTLIWDLPPELWENDVCCLSHPVHSVVLQQPEQTKTLDRDSKCCLHSNQQSLRKLCIAKINRLWCFYCPVFAVFLLPMSVALDLNFLWSMVCVYVMYRQVYSWWIFIKGICPCNQHLDHESNSSGTCLFLPQLQWKGTNAANFSNTILM